MKALRALPLSLALAFGFPGRLAWADTVADSFNDWSQSYRVVINEIHYHPPQGSAQEFLEIHNPGLAPVNIGGWAFREGIHFEFPAGTMLHPGGFLVVCQDPEVLALDFGLPADSLFAWLESGLDNAGEEVVLTDATGAPVDQVRYDDRAPWAAEADGGGPSLERLCARAGSSQPTNWAARAGQAPTPLAPNRLSQCPPPALSTPRVAINEIYYHPFNDREELEFVELTNATARDIDLQGYCFSDGLEFCFPVPTILEPGAFLVICRNEAALRAEFGIPNTVGDFAGQLSNDGERLTLLDASGRLADSVRYEDAGDWPIAADGLGFSLEKIVPDSVSDDPASWSDSGSLGPASEEGWRTVSVTGVATSDRLYFYASEAAEYLIDGVSLVNLADPGTNLISNGGFEAGIDGWTPMGNHSLSRWSQAPAGPTFPEAALHLIANGQGTGSANSVRADALSPLDRSPTVTYRLAFSYRRVSGKADLIARLSVATPSRGIYFVTGGGNQGVLSPGKANRVLRSTLPPFIGRVGRFPREPYSRDATWITALVRGSVSQVKLKVNLPGGPRELEMLDDGLSQDGAAGDGVYGAEVPPQPHHTAVTFSIEALSAGGSRVSPSPTDTMPLHGYYVNQNQPDSLLPVHTLILPALDPRSFLSGLNCSTYSECSFASGGDLYYQVGIRRRGGSVCFDGNVIKKYLKVRFHRGHEFEGQRKVNFQSLYTDKSLIRERMSWDFFQEMRSPYCLHRYVRLHANGSYLGLYAAMEHPDARFLERNGLNPQGNLYKATASREERNGTYEKETNEDGDFSDLQAFLNALHNTTASGLVTFFKANIDEDRMIDYQATQVLINNSDYPHKNHYLYHDIARDRWMPVAWDLDLTFGKLWDGTYGGVLNDKMHNPGITPWYTTNVRGEGTGNHLLDKFFSQAGTYYRRAYLVRLWDALEEKYTPLIFEGKITSLREQIYDEQLEDIAAWGRSPPTANDPSAPAAFDLNLERVRQHVKSRRTYLLNYLRTTERFSGHDRLKITEVMYHPPGGEEAEFLELWNNSGREIDIGGWWIEGLGETDLQQNRAEFKFPPGTRVAADEVIIVAKDPVLFEARHGTVGRIFGPYPGNLDQNGETLRVKDAGPGHPATVDVLRYETREPWPIRPDGLGYSLELFDVEPNLDNDLARHWRSSLTPGGSPGFVHRPGVTTFFRRGNCNSDSAVDISDALGILFYLFARGFRPPCLDGCDVSGNQVIGIEDAILLLQYLFQSGAQIPSPSPTECQPAREGFCETSNC